METKKLNKQQLAYKVIRERILSGEYPPGFRVVINQIAKELSLSAIPVREAIRQLESDGLIKYEANVGAIVSAIDENEYLETLTVLAVLEGYATALSAENIPKEKFSELEEINNTLEKAIEDFDFSLFGSLNRKFHALTYEYCHNKYLVESIKSAWERLDRIRTMGAAFIPGRSRHSVEEHKHIIKLLKGNHSFEEIEEYVRMHKMNTVRAFLKRRDQS